MQSGDLPSAKTSLLKIPTTGADGYSLMQQVAGHFEEETEFNNESIFEIVFLR